MSHRILKVLGVGLLVICLLALGGTAMAAPGGNSLTARAVRFQEADNIIHILVFDDAGRPGQPPAVVAEGDVIVLVFEWELDTLEALRATYFDNPDHTITLSIDGLPAFSVRGGYQPPFYAETLSGPRWSWDHDGDGPGDGDGDGIGDWNGPVMFFRYPVTGLSVGTHSLALAVEDQGVIVNEVITVEIVP